MTTGRRAAWIASSALCLMGCADSPAAPPDLAPPDLASPDLAPPPMFVPSEIQFDEIDDDRVPRIVQTASLDPQHDVGAIDGPGVAVGDVDGDGRPDLFLVGGGLYLNRADARGFRLEAASFPSLDFAAAAAAFGDFDRDGDLDLALAGYGALRVYANDGTGRFTEAATGITYPAKDVAVTVAWGDLDGDGWLDLAVGNYGLVWDPAQDQQHPHLYLNDRQGHFAALPDPIARRSIVTAFADLDGDGRLDVYFGDDREVAFLDPAVARHDLVLLNRGLDATGLPVLVESSAALGLDGARDTMGLAVGDSTNAGGWDLFLSDARAGWLYRSSDGDGGGRFADVTPSSGIDLTGPPPSQTKQTWYQWGGQFADLDGDGNEDLLVGQTNLFETPTAELELGPLLLRNRGGRFELQRFAFGAPMSARAVVAVDLDLDGDQDFVVAPYMDRFRFVANQTAPRGFLRVRLVPTVSAPGAAGAVVVAQSGPFTQRRMRLSGGQPSSQGEEILDFALPGGADLTVTWPSGAVQTVHGVQPASQIDVTEPRWIVVGAGVLEVDVRAAGVGQPGSRVTLLEQGQRREAIADASGRVRFDIGAASKVTLTVDGRELPAHPAVQ
jgi:hypothetical protein